ncbi:MAG: lysine biosynthesis protein LysW [Candidatus Omnitrophica bacterium]|nr:lysine biosynthesis protein LysW [Candidatus Omnitrophota bacterium]MDD5429510.1 lysine biosynthesis protein LysW [Candidatus Omnitrophota bacterium]
MGRQFRCPACKEYFELEEGLIKGDVTCCSECFEELEVMSIEPLRLEKVSSF